jgi:hypothetical protein
MIAVINLTDKVLDHGKDNPSVDLVKNKKRISEPIGLVKRSDNEIFLVEHSTHLLD